MTGTGTHLPLSPSALKGRGGTQAARAHSPSPPLGAERAGERWGCSLFSVSGLFGAALSAVLLAGLLLATSSTAADDPFAEERAAMVRAVAETTEETAEWIGKAALSPRVMEAMGRVPRHLFVPPDLQDMGYLNRPLPIGYGQTISQPYIVALMTDLLEPEPDDVAFELGTGSSYQAAVLGRARCRGLHGRDRAASRCERHGAARGARLRQRDRAGRRRLSRLAGARALRYRRGDRCREPRAAAAHRPA